MTDCHSATHLTSSPRADSCHPAASLDRSFERPASRGRLRAPADGAGEPSSRRPVADWRGRRAYLRALEGDGPTEWVWSSFAEYLDAVEAYADTDELVAVAEVAAEFGAPLVPHVRNEGRDVLRAVEEMVEVSRRSGARLHLSHLSEVTCRRSTHRATAVPGRRRRSDLRPVSVRCRVDAACKPVAAMGAGGRGHRNACACA
jgi:hypothetical protein